MFTILLILLLCRCVRKYFVGRAQSENNLCFLLTLFVIINCDWLVKGGYLMKNCIPVK